MKLKVDYRFLTSVVLLYPLALGGLFLFNISPFPITAPFFFLLLLLLGYILIKKDKVSFASSYSRTLFLLVVLLGISVFNYSSIRYSLPVLFCLFILFFYWYLTTISDYSYGNIGPLLEKAFFAYVLVSLFFLLLPHTHMEIGNRFIGFSGSPTTYAAIMATLFVFLDSNKQNWDLKRVGAYLLVLGLVYLSKTRLILVFLLLYPFVLLVMTRRRVMYRTVFLVFFFALFFLYAIYGVVVDYFPQLVTLRYEDGRDASFGLRYYLFELITNNFFSGGYYEMILGKGNEFSRLLVESEIGMDIYPHNDFYRLMNDWGVIGAFVFFLFLYRISGRNRTALMISLLYLILFYSNMVFNLFLISILILASFLPMSLYSKPKEEPDVSK